MKKLLVCVLLLVVVAGMVSAVDLLNTRPLKKAVQPYVEKWGEYNYYIILMHPWEGMFAGFSWWDDQGQALHYVIFIYLNNEWILGEASEELQEIPANVG
jgi:hypothetical protein